MNSVGKFLTLSAIGVSAIWLTTDRPRAQSSSIIVTPSNASLVVGQTQQLTTSGGVVPIAIATGNWHSCMRFSDQSVRCTGRNNQGQIGNNSLSNTSDPVAPNGLVNAATVRAGGEHTCSLINDGTMQCWGTNYTGQLGDGTIGGFAMVPQPVHGISGAISAVTGGFHTCAILSDHTVRCWGRNQDGQIGNGDSTTDVTLPVAVTGLGAVADLSAGGYHTCALMPDSTVRCWGRNGRGALGDGTIDNKSTPSPVSGMTTAAALAMGGYHSCARLQNGTVQCWGDSGFGQIGNPSLAFSSVPATVNGISGAVAITSGWWHSCALLSDGTVRCWGDNESGQLGDGTTTNSATPVLVSGILNPIAVAAGGLHTCALMRDASVQCWGYNSFGALGNGTFTDSRSPVKVNGTGLTWTSSNAGVATVSTSGMVTAVSQGTTTISATDGFGNSGTATITVGGQFTLATLRQGDGTGTLTSNPAGINCGTACSASFAGNSQVTLTAAPGADSTFAGWTGCDSVSGATCTVTMADNKSVTAIFMLRRFTLSAAKSGNGTIISNPAGINCGTACSASFVSNSQVTMTAAPGADSNFAGWTGCDSVSGTTCTVVMTNNKSVTASFTLKRFTLSVTKAGIGHGTVTSSPAGIACGTTCSSQFVINTTVTLTASPALGSLFTGWSGCDAVADDKCTVTVRANTSVTANFLGLPLF